MTLRFYFYKARLFPGLIEKIQGTLFSDFAIGVDHGKGEVVYRVGTFKVRATPKEKWNAEIIEKHTIIIPGNTHYEVRAYIQEFLIRWYWWNSIKRSLKLFALWIFPSLPIDPGLPCMDLAFYFLKRFSPQIKINNPESISLKEAHKLIRYIVAHGLIR